MFFWAYLMIPPSSWSLIDFMTVGTNTTVVPVLRQLSSAYGISQWFFGLVLAVTPSKLRYRLLHPASRTSRAASGSIAWRMPLVFIWM